MHFRQLAIITLASSFGLGISSGAALAQDAKQDMKNAGTETKDATKDAGNGVAKGTKKAYHSTVNGTKVAADKTADTSKPQPIRRPPVPKKPSTRSKASPRLNNRAHEGLAMRRPLYLRLELLTSATES
jgi:hypothetical protein